MSLGIRNQESGIRCVCLRGSRSHKSILHDFVRFLFFLFFFFARFEASGFSFPGGGSGLWSGL